MTRISKEVAFERGEREFKNFKEEQRGCLYTYLTWFSSSALTCGRKQKQPLLKNVKGEACLQEDLGVR